MLLPTPTRGGGDGQGAPGLSFCRMNWKEGEGWESGNAEGREMTLGTRGHSRIGPSTALSPFSPDPDVQLPLSVLTLPDSRPYQLPGTSADPQHLPPATKPCPIPLV